MDPLEADGLLVRVPRLPPLFQFKPQFEQIERRQADVFDNQCRFIELIDLRPAVGGRTSAGFNSSIIRRDLRCSFARSYEKTRIVTAKSERI